MEPKPQVPSVNNDCADNLRDVGQ